MPDNSHDVMRGKRERLLELLVTTSYLETEAPSFHLSSGKQSKYYIDCKMALSHPEARRLIGEFAITKLHDQGFQAVGGLALGAYPIAIAISDALYHLDGREIRAFVVRKDPKTHGLQKFLEGDVTRGDRVLIVDDVITTGVSTLTAIEKSQEADLKIVQALVIVDRQEDNGRQNIESHGIAFDALFTLPELSQFYHEMHAHR